MLRTNFYAAVLSSTAKSSIFNKSLRFQLRSLATAATFPLQESQIELENARPFEEIPGPSALRFLRNHLPGGKYCNLPLDKLFDAMQADYGSILVMPSLFGKPPIVATFNAEDFEKVFRNEGIWPQRLAVETLSYHRLKHRADFFEGVEGLVTSQDEVWSNFRSKVNPIMMQPKNVRLYLQKLSEVNKDFIEIMKKLRNSQTNELPENFEKFINRWTLESVSVVALDKRLGLLKAEAVDPLAQKLFQGINDFMVLSADLDLKPSLWKFIPTPGFKRIMKANDDILDVTQHYINEALEHLKTAAERGNNLEKLNNEKSVLEKLIEIDKKTAIVMAIDMMMAGVDTTSNTFASIMLCLAKNPAKQAKLREEVLRILPNKDSEFTESSLNDMSYLRACLKESMRIYPLIFGNGRIVQRDVNLSGYRVPKGTMVFMLIININKDEHHYARPQEFLPERWLRTSKETNVVKGCPAVNLKSNNPFTFLPFGFGPRSCIGRRIAELELELGVARIIRNFDVRFNYPTENAFKFKLLNAPNIPLKFEIKDLDF